MQPLERQILAQWERISERAPERFNEFKKKGDPNELSAIARYIWNISLCEALYPAFHCFEIVLKNAIHNSATAEHANEMWFDTIQLHDEESRMLTAARDSIARRDQENSLTRTLTSDRIVAELPLGFWTSILTRPNYETNVLRPCLARDLKLIPTDCRDRNFLYERLREIRRLRNRVSHHEPIWNRPGLMAEYDQIRDTVKWIDTPFDELMMARCRFKKIYKESWVPTRDAFETHLKNELKKAGILNPAP
jgi:hypothetical protein